MTARPKVLWGVCGIGHGHIFRQRPLIEHFAKTSDIVIFGYGESYNFYKKHFANTPHVTVARVAVPFYVGNKTGLDFNATAMRPDNNQNYMAINGAAMAHAAQRLAPRPDLVVSDYEPISAQYAYAHNAPLVTLDQQSKYLCGDFKTPLQGQTFDDEVMRLRLFFPKATHRLACSFFKVAKKPDAYEDVAILPPVLHTNITGLTRTPNGTRTSILMYVSAQQPFGQSFADIAALCATQPNVQFHFFGKHIPPAASTPNLQIYPHGDPRFYDVLATCHCIISTAGHSLLSEAMYLGIPVYAIPLPLYEQVMNAHVIDAHGFGMSAPRLDAQSLDNFIKSIPRYTATIQADRTALLRTDGTAQIIRRLEKEIDKRLRR